MADVPAKMPPPAAILPPLKFVSLTFSPRTACAPAPPTIEPEFVTVARLAATMAVASAVVERMDPALVTVTLPRPRAGSPLAKMALALDEILPLTSLVTTTSPVCEKIAVPPLVIVPELFTVAVLNALMAMLPPEMVPVLAVTLTVSPEMPEAFTPPMMVPELATFATPLASMPVSVASVDRIVPSLLTVASPPEKTASKPEIVPDLVLTTVTLVVPCCPRIAVPWSAEWCRNWSRCRYWSPRWP